MTSCEVDNNSAIGGGASTNNHSSNVIGGDATGGAVDALTLGEDSNGDKGTITNQGVAADSTFAGNQAVGGFAIANTDVESPSSGAAYGGNAYAGGLSVSQVLECTIANNSVANATVDASGGPAYPGVVGGGGVGPGQGPTVLVAVAGTTGELQLAFADGTLFANLPDDGPSYTIENSTIAYNSARAGTGSGNSVAFSAAFGGGVDDATEFVDLNRSPEITPYANVLLYSTIVAKNTATQYPDGFNFGPDIAGGGELGGAGTPIPSFNLIGIRDDTDPNFLQSGRQTVSPFEFLPNANDDLVGTASASIDPLLGSLASNGGPTQTMALGTGSQAIDMGSDAQGAFPSDQRGAPFFRSVPVLGPAGGSYDGTDVGAFEDQGASVASVVVNDGNAQRSEVYSITVTFDEPVVFASGNAAAAFELDQYDDNGVTGTVALDAVVGANSMGGTTVTLTFDVSQSSSLVDPISAENGGGRFGPISLADGRYRLTIHAADVTFAADNIELSGNGVNSGTDYATPTETPTSSSLHLWRLFGDADGNGVVDQHALAAFRAANNTTENGPGGIGYAEFVYYYDADNSGTIDQVDLAQFRERNNDNVFDL